MKPSKKTLLALAFCAPILLACADQAVNAYEPADGSAAAPADAPVDTTHTVTAAIGDDAAAVTDAPRPSREPDVI